MIIKNCIKYKIEFFSDFYAEISKYKFMLTLENAVCPDYITEKLWRALQLGVIPIYLGRSSLYPIYI